MTSSVAAQAAEIRQPEVPVENKILQEETILSAEETAQETDWRLLLVNPWNQLPAEYQIELKRMTNGLYVDARIYDDLSAMLGACWDAGLHPVVCSAYRSNATQQRLHTNKINRLIWAGYSRVDAEKEAARWVAVPGTSEHQTGMALDIVSYSYQNLTKQQENTAEQKWLMEHCWEYGFVLRYPADKCEITGIGYEPWHYRYVGRETAAAMREKGLCLEEYLALPVEDPQVQEAREEPIVPLWEQAAQWAAPTAAANQ